MKKRFVLPTNSAKVSQRSPESSMKFMQHQQNPLQLGQQIHQIILNSDVQTVLPQIAQALGAAFQVDGCLIVAIPETSTAASGYWFAASDVEIPCLSMLVSKKQLATARQMQTELVVIDDVATVKTKSLTNWQDLQFSPQALLEIPLWFQGKINGVISFVCLQPRHWSKLEQQEALAVSEPVAIAISQTLQAKSIAALQQQVEAAKTYQSLVNKLMMASRSSLELSQILQMAVTDTTQALQVDQGLILTLKYADPLFKTRSRKNLPKAKVTVVCVSSQKHNLLNQSFWLTDSYLCQQAFSNFPQPLAIANQEELAAIVPLASVEPLFNLNLLPALLMFPLESGGTILGFLVLQHSSDRYWQVEELAFIELICAQLSTAIIQHQTLRQVQSLVEERTAQLQRSLEVQAKLYEKTRQQIDQLRQLNQLKDEFLSTISHELRTPLTSMSLAIRMLRQPGITTDRQVKYLDILEQQCNQEIKLINDLLTLQELELHQASLKLETIDLKAKIYDLAQSFEEKWADKGLRIDLNLPSNSLSLQTDLESLERIFQELLTNAGKYSDPDTTIILKASANAHPINQIVVSLTNFGAGISPEDATNIFDKFRRGQGVTQQAIQGTGLGLSLVKSLVQHLNGAIAVSSTPTTSPSCYETCFTLTLPQIFDNTKP